MFHKSAYLKTRVFSTKILLIHYFINTIMYIQNNTTDFNLNQLTTTEI